MVLRSIEEVRVGSIPTGGNVVYVFMSRMIKISKHENDRPGLLFIFFTKIYYSCYPKIRTS